MEYELVEWQDEPETRQVTVPEAPLMVLGGKRWLDPSAYVRAATQNAELIPEEASGSSAINPRAGLVQLE